MSGSRLLLTPSTTGGSNMVIRDVTYYAFTKSREFSVFSSETHLNWHWYLSRPNSQEWWNPLRGKIRISISLDMPLSWLEPDLPIGATLALMRNTNREQYCDYCKLRYAHLAQHRELHPLAKKPAYWKIISEHPNRKGQVRFYCLECAADNQNWPDETFWSLKEQLTHSLKTIANQEQLNVKLD